MPTHAANQGPSIVADRYRVDEVLGRGGMAEVFRVTDLTDEKRCALKRLRITEKVKDPQVRVHLFEREYHMLAQLSHPRVIEVYDYGVDEEGPYYVMELLDGDDLAARGDLGWREICSLVRDVCLSLALLHARGMIHRDVTVRNIRCGSDGRAKLIDFGAMAPMGPLKDVVGTPPYVPPEVMERQSVDGRADLFAIGAVLYNALTGRHAYPARRVRDLRDHWRSRPVEPKALNPEIPDALQQLVLSLLSLDRAARPKHAAEVVDRLGVIAGLEPEHDLAVEQAYLTAPVLVGRVEELVAIRRRILHAMRGGGSAVLVEGAVGIGRSRLLDASALEGRLAGAVVLRGRGSDRSGGFGVIRALAAQLIEACPEATPEDRELAGLIRRDRHVSAPSPSVRLEEDASLPGRLVNWFLENSRSQTLVVIVDDMHLVDVQSAAVIARLVDASANRRLMAIAAATTGAETVCTQALRVVRDCSQSMTLTPLDEEQALELVRSVFGDVLNVQLAANRIHEIAQGNPQAIMDLAKWLVDKGHVKYEAGHWVLPRALSRLPLPTSLDDALRMKVSRLSNEAVTLGVAVMLAEEVDLAVDEYRVLFSGQASGSMHKALDELLAADVVMPRAEGFGLSSAVYRELLVERSSPGALNWVRQRIAEACLAQGQPDWAIQHLFAGGARSQAVELLLERLRNGFRPALILRTYDGRVAFMRQVLNFCRHQGRPAAEIFAVKNELVKCAETMISLVREDIRELGAEYKELSGYTEWQRLSDDMDPKARIGTAMQRATARYQRLPASEQVMAPAEALPEMLQFIGFCLAGAMATYDIKVLDDLPPLEPFVVLSDSIRLLAKYVVAVREINGARFDVARAMLSDMLQELDGEAGAAMGAAGQQMKVHALIATGLIDAASARHSALQAADRLDRIADSMGDPHYRTHALRVRQQYYLRLGDWQQAERWGHQIELDKLSDATAHPNASGIVTLGFMYAGVESVAGVKDCLTQLQAYRDVSAGLWAIERYLAAEYDRLRGAPERALPQFLELLEHVDPDVDTSWSFVVGGALLAHQNAGRFEEGKQLGYEMLQRADAVGLRYMRRLIVVPLALNEASLGHFDTAVALLDDAIEHQIGLDSRGINLGLIYEARARVAAWADDKDAFDKYASLCAKLYRAGGGNPDLTARYEALIAEAERVELGVSSKLVEAMHGSQPTHDAQESAVLEELRRTAGNDDSERVLRLLVDRSRAQAGALYVLEGDEPRLVASHDCAPDAEFASHVRAYVVSILGASLSTDTATDDDGDTHVTLGSGQAFNLTILGYDDGSGYEPVGVAALAGDDLKRLSWAVLNSVAGYLGAHLRDEPRRTG